MKKKTILFIITLLFIFITCKSMRIVEPKSENRSIIALSCKIPAALGSGQNPRANVCFAKLEDRNNIKSYTKIIESTSFDGEYTYLLNAEPGIYAAVAAIHRHEYSDSRYEYFFDEKTVRSTIVEVKPHTLNYIGELLVDPSFVTSLRSKLSGEADAIQDFYYYPILKSLEYSRDSYKYEASFKSLEVKERDAFLSKAREAFKKSKWLEFFK